MSGDRAAREAPQWKSGPRQPETAPSRRETDETARRGPRRGRRRARSRTRSGLLQELRLGRGVARATVRRVPLISCDGLTGWRLELLGPRSARPSRMSDAPALADE